VLTINGGVRLDVAAHIRAHPLDYGALIGPSLSDFEAQAFLDSHPGASVLKRPLGPSTVYILVSRA
jgi:hypothetical protein